MSEKLGKYKLPKNWVWTTLGELGIVVSGGTPPTRNPQFWGGDISWITPADLSGYKDKYISRGRRNISELGVEYSAAKLLPENTILFSSRAPIGYVVIAREALTTNQGFKNLIPLPSTYTDYLYYYLLSAKQLAESLASGTTFLELSASSFNKIPVPFPPLDEQHRIVGKLEELVSELDKTKEQFETAISQLQVYRQLILDLAVEGKLPNSNSENKKHQAAWSKVNMGDVFEEPKYGTSKKCDYNVRGRAVLRIPNITRGTIDSTDLKYSDFDRNEIEAFSLKEDDLLLIRSNGSLDLVGKSALVTKRDEEYLYAGYLIRLRPLKDLVNSKFILYVLSSSNVRGQIESKAKSTSGVNNINSGELKSLIIPFTSLEEQTLIVQEIENRLSVCDKVSDAITVNLHKIEVLRHSILKKAFEGKLVEQDPNDENAAILIERLKEEHELLILDRIKKRQSQSLKITEMETLKSILQLVRESKKPIAAHDLWQLSEHRDDIDAFYAKLKELLEKGEIKEMPRRGKESFLTHTTSK